MDYSLEHTNTKQDFSTGAQRDTQEGKARIDLISPVFLERLGMVLTKGAEHYGERNWEKGIPLSRILASASRHLNQTIDGLEDEDHPAQCAWNMMAYIHTLHRIRTGSLPAELDDLPREKNLATRPRKPWPVKDMPDIYRRCTCADPRCHICAGRLNWLKEQLSEEKNLKTDLTSDKKPPTVEQDRRRVKRCCPECKKELTQKQELDSFNYIGYLCPHCGNKMSGCTIHPRDC